MKSVTAVAQLVAVAACVLATAAQAKTLPMAGIQSPPDMTAGRPGDQCRASDPRTGLAPAISNTMTGSLVGCWYTDIFDQVQSSRLGEILAIGTEHFVGCLDANRNGRCSHRDPHGSLAFIYAFEGKFDRAGKEIRGQCQHPIVSGTGDFTGASGRLDFTDNVATRTSAYRGKIMLPTRSHHARATTDAAHRTALTAC